MGSAYVPFEGYCSKCDRAVERDIKTTSPDFYYIRCRECGILRVAYPKNSPPREREGQHTENGMVTE